VGVGQNAERAQCGLYKGWALRSAAPPVLVFITKAKFKISRKISYNHTDLLWDLAKPCACITLMPVYNLSLPYRHEN
jgi:hypothetical protein